MFNLNDFKNTSAKTSRYKRRISKLLEQHKIGLFGAITSKPKDAAAAELSPELQGKGSNGKFYLQTELKDIISFASDRGILIVPEFDMPGHSKSWFAGYPELASSPGPYKPACRSSRLCAALSR